ncbi:MAG: hypothetical protein NWQ13_03970, partial [Glaciimonas sp.]|nr:hypothetical protein [Glaciimonas sp.]
MTNSTSIISPTLTPATAPKVGFVSLGCPKALVDSEQILTQLRAEGYETAYNRTGPMWVNDRMFGFTPEGYSKVWVNEDFANNHPSHPRKILD